MRMEANASLGNGQRLIVLLGVVSGMGRLRSRGFAQTSSTCPEPDLCSGSMTSVISQLQRSAGKLAVHRFSKMRLIPDARLYSRTPSFIV